MTECSDFMAHRDFFGRFFWWLFGLIVLVDIILRRSYFLSVEPSKIGIYALSILLEVSFFSILVQTLGSQTGRFKWFKIFSLMIVSCVYVCVLLSSWGFYLYFSRLPGVYGFTYLLEAPEESYNLVVHSLTPGVMIGLGLFVAVFFLCLKAAQTAFERKHMKWVVLGFLGLIPVLNHNLLISTGAALPVIDSIYGTVNAAVAKQQGKLLFRLQPRLSRNIETPSDRAARFNGVLIINESLRKSSLSAFGYSRKTTPHLDALLSEFNEQAFCFEHAFSNTIMTYFALPSILSGRSTIEGINSMQSSRLIYEEVKRLSGLKTALISSHSYLPGNFKAFIESKSLDFLWYREIEDLPAYNNIGVDDKYVADRFVSFLDQLKKDEKFFVILHVNGTHYPYTVPESFNIFKGEHSLYDTYDNAVFYLDFNLQKIFEALNSKNLSSSTWIMLTSDHAETLGEEGSYGHVGDFTIWNTNIPLILAIPKDIQKFLNVDVSNLEKNKFAITGNTDVVPTILDLYGLLVDAEKYKGKSLFSLIEKDRIYEIYNPPAADLEEQLGIPHWVNNELSIEKIPIKR